MSIVNVLTAKAKSWKVTGGVRRVRDVVAEDSGTISGRCSGGGNDARALQYRLPGEIDSRGIKYKGNGLWRPEIKR